MEYINFNDKKLPIGKRKQAYIKWAVSKGTKLIEAQRQANKKFGFEKKEGALFVVRDWAWVQHKSSFNNKDYVFDPIDLRRYKDYKIIDGRNEENETAIKQFKELGWDIFYRDLWD